MLGALAIAVLRQKLALLLQIKLYSAHLSRRTEDGKVYYTMFRRLPEPWIFNPCHFSQAVACFHFTTLIRVGTCAHLKLSLSTSGERLLT
jgi:hypothetical protein